MGFGLTNYCLFKHDTQLDPLRDGSRLASGGDDCTTRVFDATTGETILVLRTEGRTNGVAWSPITDGAAAARLAAATDRGRLRVFDAATGAADFECDAPPPPFDAGRNRGYRTVAWSPNGARLAVGTGGGRARVCSHDNTFSRSTQGFRERETRAAFHWWRAAKTDELRLQLWCE